MKLLTSKKHERVTIVVERVDDPKRRIARKSQGKMSGLSIHEFIAVLFKANELLPVAKKLTDEAMIRKLVAEFPDSKGVKSIAVGKITLNHYRGLYNRGELFPVQGEAPEPAKVPSQRWAKDKQGRMVVVDGRTGKPLPK